MTKKIIGAQGEITIIQIDALPEGVETRPFKERVAQGHIISHSEAGHHHLLDGGEVLERVDAPQGIRVLYALLDKPARLFQNAAVPHEPFDLPAGVIEFRIAREFDPFAEQARRVAD